MTTTKAHTNGRPATPSECACGSGLAAEFTVVTRNGGAALVCADCVEAQRITNDGYEATYVFEGDEWVEWFPPALVTAVLVRDRCRCVLCGKLVWPTDRHALVVGRLLTLADALALGVCPAEYNHPDNLIATCDRHRRRDASMAPLDVLRVHLKRLRRLAGDPDDDAWFR